MKKVFAVILVIALTLTLCISISSVAWAEGTVRLRISVSPGSLTGAGSVKLNAEVINETDSEIQNVVLNYPDGSGDSVALENIPAGESRSHSNEAWSVSDEMLGTDLTFTADFTAADGSSKQVSATLNIARKESVVDVSGSASADVTAIKAGDSVNFTFVLQNDGNVKIDDCALKAPPIKNGAQIGDTFSLSPGQKRTLTWKVAVNESMDVQPSFTYTVNGEAQTLNLDTVSITTEAAKKGSMSVSATADKTAVKSGDKVQLKVEVKNSGTADLTDLTVVDGSGNKVTMDSTSLAANGQSATGTLEITADQAKSYTFTASARDAAGNEVKASSTPVQIRLDAQASPTASVDASGVLTLEVTFSTVSLSKAGPVDFSIKINNLSGQELKNVVVTEPTIGEIANLPSMTDAQQVVDKTVEVDQTTSYTFTVSAELPDGTKVESSTPAQTVTLNNKAVGGMTGLLILVIVIICAIIGVAIALGVMVHKSKKAQQSGGNGKKGQTRSQQPSGTQRPQQRSQQQRQAPPAQTRRRMPQESIEPRATQKKRTTQKKGGSNYGDRNKF